MHTTQPTGILQYVIPVVIFVVVFGLRARRMSQIRPLKLEYLWIVPAIYVVLMVSSFVAKPPSLNGWLAALVAVVLGTVIGWRRGMMMQISVDPETGTLRQKGSPLAILFLLAIILVKLGAQAEGTALHFDAQLVTDAALAFGLGMFGATRVEMYLRGRKLLEEARV